MRWWVWWQASQQSAYGNGMPQPTQPQQAPQMMHTYGGQGYDAGQGMNIIVSAFLMLYFSMCVMAHRDSLFFCFFAASHKP